MKPRFNDLSDYTPYLGELRRRLLVVLLFFSIGFIAGFTFFRQIINHLVALFNFDAVDLMVTSPFQIFSLAVNIGLFLGLVASLPIIVYQLLAFIGPALKKEERKQIAPFGFLSLGLFGTGFVFGLFLMRWVIFGFSQTFNNSLVNNYWDLGLFLSQIFLTAAFLGVVFQFPLVIKLLVVTGVTSVEELRTKRRWVIAGSFILVALLPPTDAFSLVIMVLPLIGLYELTLALLARGSKRR